MAEASVDVVSILYDYFKEESENHQREDGVFWVTDLVSCPLKREYELRFPELGLAQLFKPNLVQGTLVHLGLESLLKEKLEETGARVFVEPEGQIEVRPLDFLQSDDRKYTVKGRIDLIAVYHAVRIGFEIKTARADLSLPHAHHLDQVKIYNTIFQLDSSYLVYVTPDRITQYEVRDKMGLDEIARRIGERKAPRYDWECQYCPYAVLCPRKVARNRR